MKAYYLMALVISGIGMGIAVSYQSIGWFIYFVICAAVNLIGVHRV